MKYILAIIFIYSSCAYVINRGLTIKQSFILLNNINNISTPEQLNDQFKNGLNLTQIRNQLKKKEMINQNKSFNISAVREYIHNQLDNNSTNIKNRSQ